MSTKKYDGENRSDGRANQSPYPVQRLAPSMDLVDLAKTISDANLSIQNSATGKLKLIAQQIKSLQEEARSIMQKVHDDKLLHKAECNMPRIPGRLYHLYQRQEDQLYFSLLSPEDWKGCPPHEYIGCYRLEHDMTWTDVNTEPDEDITPYIEKMLIE